VQPLREHWRGEGDEIVQTFAIVTTDANTPMRAVHNRMPVILARDDWAEWLDVAPQPTLN
jgi:putative SOS response-associated peptidase YedK